MELGLLAPCELSVKVHKPRERAFLIQCRFASPFPFNCRNTPTNTLTSPSTHPPSAFLLLQQQPNQSSISHF